MGAIVDKVNVYVEKNQLEELVQYLVAQAKGTYYSNQAVMLSASYHEYLRNELEGSIPSNHKAERLRMFKNALYIAQNLEEELGV